MSATRDFVISRVFDASRELVFKAWTDPARMAKWWGPRVMTTPVCELDARPGGAYRVVMRAPDGTDYPITGVYREVAPPERLVLTMDCREHPAAWHDLVKPNRRPDETNPAGELLTTVTFEDVAGKTKLTVRVTFQSDEIGDAMLKMGMNEGWSQSLDRLAELTQS
ncbi:MAG: SRPBCC family protein [Methylacidiphilales bacterium]|nr:SRPBCC family protein [Candidatus Methylacidiphilales bacterium]